MKKLECIALTGALVMGLLKKYFFHFIENFASMAVNVYAKH